MSIIHFSSNVRGSVTILNADKGKEGVAENYNTVVIDIRYSMLNSFKNCQSFSGIN